MILFVEQIILKVQRFYFERMFWFLRFWKIHDLFHSRSSSILNNCFSIFESLLSIIDKLFHFISFFLFIFYFEISFRYFLNEYTPIFQFFSFPLFDNEQSWNGRGNQLAAGILPDWSFRWINPGAESDYKDRWKLKMRRIKFIK